MGLILDLLRGTAGENALNDHTGAWRQAVSRAVEALLQGSGGGGVPLGNATPQPIGTIGFVGTSFFASHEDHVHAHGDLPGGSLHALVTTLTAGFMSAADKAALDALVGAGPFVPAARTLTAGAGLTGGGDLSADRIFDVIALDTTIDVQANGIRVDPLLVAIILNSVPQTRTLTAGAGLTGGGDLSADRTFNVGATNATVIIDADGIRLATPIQFGPSGQAVVQGVAVTPGWNVFGAFVFDGAFTSAIFESTFLVTLGTLTGRVRLFDVTGGAPVVGSTLSSSSTTDTTQVSANIIANLTATHLYQFQAECTGGSTSDDFIVVREARLLVT